MVNDKQVLVAGNWKLNNDFETSKKLAAEVVALTRNTKQDVEICLIPPHPFLRIVGDQIKGHSNIKLGAQAAWYEEKGAFTGAISVGQLKSVGCEYVVVGHSERRKIFGETDEIVNKIVKAVIKEGLKPILCIGN